MDFVRFVKPQIWWLKSASVFDISELVSTFSSEPTCVVVSPDKQLIVVATGRGTLHIVHAQTGQVGSFSPRVCFDFSFRLNLPQELHIVSYICSTEAVKLSSWSKQSTTFSKVVIPIKWPLKIEIMCAEILGENLK